MANRTALINLIIKSLLLFAAVISLQLFAGAAVGQTRDHLTDAETDLIRFHQELDKRMDFYGSYIVGHKHFERTRTDAALREGERFAYTDVPLAANQRTNSGPSLTGYSAKPASSAG